MTDILDDVQISIHNSKKASVKVEFASLYLAHDDVVCIHVNLKLKWVEVTAISGDENGLPGICVQPIPEEDGDEVVETEIKFPKYRNWRVFATDTSKYLLSVCLTKLNHDQNPR